MEEARTRHVELRFVNTICCAGATTAGSRSWKATSTSLHTHPSSLFWQSKHFPRNYLYKMDKFSSSRAHQRASLCREWTNLGWLEGVKAVGIPSDSSRWGAQSRHSPCHFFPVHEILSFIHTSKMSHHSPPPRTKHRKKCQVEKGGRDGWRKNNLFSVCAIIIRYRIYFRSCYINTEEERVNGAKLGDGGGWADEKVGECAMVFQSIFSAGNCRVTCCELSGDFFQLAAVSIESYVTGRIGNGEVVFGREAQRNSFNYGCGRDKLFGGKFVAHVTAVAW